MLNKKFILVLTLCRKNKLRMISKATIVQFIEHKLLQPSLYVYKLCKKTQGLFSFDRFVFINQKYWYSENYIFFTQYIHFLLAEGNFNVLWCNWWLCFTCQSGCNRTSYNTGTKIKEDQDQYQLWYMYLTDKLFHTLSHNLSHSTNSLVRDDWENCFLHHSLRTMRIGRLLIWSVDLWIFLK